MHGLESGVIVTADTLEELWSDERRMREFSACKIPERDVPWETIVCAPMMVRGQATGVLQGFLQATLLPEGDVLAFLDAIGDQAAVAVRRTAAPAVRPLTSITRGSESPCLTRASPGATATSV
jgi:hypothetical protein